MTEGLRRWLPFAGKDVCRKGCNFGLFVVDACETCDDIDGLFRGFGRLEENGAGGEEAMLATGLL